MTKSSRRAAQLALAALLGLAALASEAQLDTGMAAVAPADDNKADAGPWSGKVSAGYARTSGNSESSATNLGAEGRYDRKRWHHILAGTAVVTSSARNRETPSVTTAEAYWTGWQSQYDITTALYGFGSVDWYKDRFSAYDQQLYEATGLGWRVLRGKAHSLDVEAGVGARQAELQNGENQDEIIGLLRGVYTWKISENARFVQKLAILSGADNTYTESVSQLKAGIIGNLSMVLGYTYKHNSDVAIDTSLMDPRPFDKTDTYTTVSLEYGF